MKLNVRLECVSAGCLDRVPVALDSLDRLGLAGIEFAVVAGVTDGQDSDQDDGEELSTDGSPKTGTGQEGKQAGQRDAHIEREDVALRSNLHVSREIGLSVDGRGNDTSNTTHSNDHGSGNRLLGVSDSVGGLESKDRGDVGYSKGCITISEPFCDTLRNLKRLTLSSHDGEETSKVPDVLVSVVTDDQTSDKGHTSVKDDKDSSLSQLVGRDSDAEGIDGASSVRRSRETESGDLRVTLTSQNLKGY